MLLPPQHFEPWWTLVVHKMVNEPLSKGAYNLFMKLWDDQSFGELETFWLSEPLTELEQWHLSNLINKGYIDIQVEEPTEANLDKDGYNQAGEYRGGFTLVTIL